MAKVDAETQQQMSDADEVASLTRSRGWQIIHAKITERILDLQNINNLPDADPATMMNELKSRVLASKLLYAFLKEDVYGFVEQGQAAQIFDKKDTGFIDRGTEQR